MRLRFSLRAMFVATTLVAACCYWLMLPSIRAGRFADAVAAGDFQSADQMFLDPDDQFMANWHRDYWAFKPRVNLVPWSWGQFFRGQRDIHIHVIYGDSGRLTGCEGTIAATAFGLRSPQLQKFAMGGMVIAQPFR